MGLYLSLALAAPLEEVQQSTVGALREKSPNEWHEHDIHSNGGQVTIYLAKREVALLLGN